MVTYSGKYRLETQRESMKRPIRIALWLVGILIAIGITLFTAFTIGNPRSIIETGNPVGFNSGTFTDVARKRELPWHSWYPTSATDGVELVEENAVFKGFSAIRQAPVVEGKRRSLVVLSHGSGGNRANQGWLAIELARRGAVVVAPNHPGSTSRDSAPATNILAWERPADIRTVISAVLADEDAFGLIDPERIAVIGHSLGGYTALATGGARLQLDDFIAYCEELPDNPDCAFYRSGAVELERVDRRRFEDDQRDPRVAAIVAIDPAYARAFDTESLFTLAPVLLIAPHREPGAVADLQVATLAQQLPSQSEFVEIEGAHHFSFLPVCKPFGYRILDLVEDEAELLCAPETDLSRESVHTEAFERIAAFFEAQGIL